MEASSGDFVFEEITGAFAPPRVTYFDAALTLREAIFASPEVVRQRELQKKLAYESNEAIEQAIAELGGGSKNWRPPQHLSQLEPRLFVSQDVAEVLKRFATSRQRAQQGWRRIFGQTKKGADEIITAGSILGCYVLNTNGEPSYYVYRFTDQDPRAAVQTEYDNMMGYVRVQEEPDRVIEDNQPLNIIIDPKGRMEVYERWPAGYIPITARAVVADVVDLDPPLNTSPPSNSA
ncbi:MAG: hypothetical protein HY362_04600 [Candidatus Aenigmarchaeota archaeon]|nr:hypothetical protein [Candidatus Aenigmarchaeota archaeon]